MRLTLNARRATAFHEAGHLVAAWRLGLRVHGATIKPGVDYAGLVEHEKARSGESASIWTGPTAHG
jgi:hypothetical protein